MPLTFQPMTLAQWQGAVNDGSAGAQSPFLAEDVYTQAIAAARDRNIDPRVLLAWTRAENNQATNISTGLLGAKNGAGIKYVGQSRATSGANANPPVLAPASEGSAPYCVFATWGDFWWTLAVNIITILPDAWTAGDLGKIASYYTSGDPNKGAGADKVTFYQDYLTHYPPQGGQPVASVTGPDILSAALKHLGDTWETDPINGTHPVDMYCEATIELWCREAGAIQPVEPTAAANCDRLPNQSGIAPAGALVFFKGPQWSQYGHVGVGMGDGRTISGLASVTISSGWQDPTQGYQGWRYPDGVTAPAPNIGPFFVDGNPYGQVAVQPPFWNRFHYLEQQQQGLGFAMMGYPLAAEVTVNGRRIQKWERGWYGTQSAPDPWNCVSLLFSEIPKGS